MTIESVRDSPTPGWVIVNGRYEVEREAVDRIRRAPLAEHDRLAACHEEHWRRLLLQEEDPARRAKLYAEAYAGVSEIYHAVGRFAAGVGASYVRLLWPWVEGKRVLEIGCGCGLFAQGIGRTVAAYTGIDASELAIAKARELNAANLKLRFERQALPGALSGRSAYDLIYCNDFLEHLHPEDAEETIRLARLALAPKGRLVIVSPNRLFGPFDLSQTYVAKGARARCLHLSEQSYGELASSLARHGFVKKMSPLGPLGFFLLARRLPFAERLLLAPTALKVRAEASSLLRAVLRRPLGLTAVIVVAEVP